MSGMRASPRVLTLVDGARRFLLPYDPLHLPIALAQQVLRIEWCFAREQFVEKHAQREDIRPRVDIQAAHLGLLRLIPGVPII